MGGVQKFMILLKNIGFLISIVFSDRCIVYHVSSSKSCTNTCTIIHVFIIKYDYNQIVTVKIYIQIQNIE
jgi:hypothetical protein